MGRRATQVPVADGTAHGPLEDLAVLERVIEAVDAEPIDEASAHRTVMETLTTRLGLAYGAVWLPAGDGEFRLADESGELAPTMASAWARSGLRFDDTGGLGGLALRPRTPGRPSPA